LYIIPSSYFTTNYKLIGVANAFSGGIFLCVALLHLLPESTEIFEEYFDKNHQDNPENESEEHRHFPFSFLLCFCGYTFILLLEKVVFDTHSHLDMDDEGDEEEEEVQMLNVSNNYNISIPLRELSKKTLSSKYLY
jgi:zinc transporter 1/2/3